MDNTFGNWRNTVLGAGLTLVIVSAAFAVAFS